MAILPCRLQRSSVNSLMWTRRKCKSSAHILDLNTLQNKTGPRFVPPATLVARRRREIFLFSRRGLRFFFRLLHVAPQPPYPALERIIAHTVN